MQRAAIGRGAHLCCKCVATDSNSEREDGTLAPTWDGKGTLVLGFPHSPKMPSATFVLYPTCRSERRCALSLTC